MRSFDKFCFAITTQNTQDERTRGGFQVIRKMCLIGRIDTVVEMKNHIFIFEYKFNKTAQEALNQIEEKRYYAPYLNSGKQIVLIGISFNYIERAVGTREGTTFDIEWKSAEMKS